MNILHLLNLKYQARKLRETASSTQTVIMTDIILDQIQAKLNKARKDLT